MGVVRQRGLGRLPTFPRSISDPAVALIVGAPETQFRIGRHSLGLLHILNDECLLSEAATNQADRRDGLEHNPTFSF